MKKREERNFYTLGELIYLARTRKGLTRKEVADMFTKDKIDIQNVSIRGRISYSKITEKTIKEWELDLKYPPIETLYILARFLDADPNQFLNSKIYVQKHKVDGLAMKIVGLICFAIDVGSNYVGYYYKVVAVAIRIIVAWTVVAMMITFVGY